MTMHTNTWVVKIGSNLLTSGGTSINTGLIGHLTREIKMLTQSGINVILVSSGAIASGLGVLGFNEKPSDIHQLQALASIGQMDLMHTYENAFSELGMTSSQILLTNDNLTNIQRYDNIIGTINTLLSWGVVPIVNENDTVSTDEINFGDNDNLAALLSNLMQADTLVILTDQLGLYDKNPSMHDDATLIHRISKTNSALENYATKEQGSVGTGGMYSKIHAAQLATCETYITSGRNPQALTEILENNTSGTVLY